MWPRQQPGRESCQVVLLTPLLLPSWATSRARHICSSCASWTDAHAPQLLEPLAQCPHTHTQQGVCAGLRAVVAPCRPSLMCSHTWWQLQTCPNWSRLMMSTLQAWTQSSAACHMRPHRRSSAACRATSRLLTSQLTSGWLMSRHMQSGEQHIQCPEQLSRTAADPHPACAGQQQ